VIQSDDLGERRPWRSRPDVLDRRRARRAGRGRRPPDRSGVRRAAGWIAHRPPRVAIVIADHESAAGRDQLAEFGFPPIHRGRRAHDQEDRGSSRSPNVSARETLRLPERSAHFA
jgi:hypothetical protein